MKTTTVRASVAALLGFAIGIANHARGQVVLDQQNVFTSAIGDTANQFSQEIGQTFTVGVAGELAQVDVYLARFPFTTDNLVFRVYNTTGGLPNTQLGSNLLLPPAAVSTTAADFESFDVSAFNIPVAVGDVLAFTITSTGETSYILPYSETMLYGGGMPVRRVANLPPGPWEPNPGVVRDYGFRTFVEIPEPSTAALILVGACTLISVRARARSH